MQNEKRRTSVLIIEDDPFYRTLYVNQLKTIGSEFRLVTSENGYSALMSLGSKRPDLIILDLCMPRFDGVSFLQVVKSNPAYQDLPVLVISGDISMLPEKGKQYSHTYVFQKPLHANVFERIVRLALNLGQPESLQKTHRMIARGDVDLGHMRLYIGDAPQMQRAIAEQFVRLAPERIASLQSMIQKRNLSEIRNFCHGMQSTTETIGAHNLARVVREISLAAHREDLADLERLAEEFVSILQAFRHDLMATFSITEV